MIQEAQLTPAATIDVPPDWFKRFGVEFAADVDDLDAYEFAGLMVRGFVVGLLRYEHSSLGETTLLLSEGAPIEDHIREFARAFDLPIGHFRWKSLSA